MRAAALLLAAACAAAQAEPLVVGSKRFTESYIIAEILVRAAGGEPHAVHKPGLGNTGVLYAALVAGSIDVYPEYTGTIAREILKSEGRLSLQEINAALASHGLAAGVPLGFNNTYAIGVRADIADKLSLRTIGDLARHPTLRLGLSHEFLGRADGWPGLARHYGLEAIRPSGLDRCGLVLLPGALLLPASEQRGQLEVRLLGGALAGGVSHASMVPRSGAPQPRTASCHGRRGRGEVVRR